MIWQTIILHILKKKPGFPGVTGFNRNNNNNYYYSCVVFFTAGSFNDIFISEAISFILVTLPPKIKSICLFKSAI